ncbi:hypothetical protein SAMN04488003_11842 [Loktanella fryxellensis]|uniref:Uncharacterized protein n=1 Tax=Loktanella fryxellensis TaxID=245187 RepID=A0A1H8GYE6_9RHOB|nr:hypothetical protein [Loktanella fryxellensis]SEN48895.1 hypothetical protein SAMN04488003_11842 [Loktanella fryxellensis]
MARYQRSMNAVAVAGAGDRASVGGPTGRAMRNAPTQAVSA